MVEAPKGNFEDFKTAVLSCRLKVGSSELRYARELLDAAKSNIRSCQILYEHGQYAESIFLLEQAAEKADKALLLSAGLFNKKDLTSVGHDASKTSNLVLERGASLIDFTSVFDPRPDNPDAVTTRGKSAVEVARSSRTSIMETVAESEKYAREYFANLDDWLHEENKTGRIAGEIGRRLESADLLIEAIVSYGKCVMITHFTSPHAVSARYPVKMGPKDYTADLGIVAATPDLASIVEQAISAVERLFPQTRDSNS